MSIKNYKLNNQVLFINKLLSVKCILYITLSNDCLWCVNDLAAYTCHGSYVKSKLLGNFKQSIHRSKRNLHISPNWTGNKVAWNWKTQGTRTSNVYLSQAHILTFHYLILINIYLSLLLIITICIDTFLRIGNPQVLLMAFMMLGKYENIVIVATAYEM